MVIIIKKMNPGTQIQAEINKKGGGTPNPFTVSQMPFFRSFWALLFQQGCVKIEFPGCGRPQRLMTEPLQYFVGAGLRGLPGNLTFWTTLTHLRLFQHPLHTCRTTGAAPRARVL